MLKRHPLPASRRRVAWASGPLVLVGALLAGCGAGGDDTADWLFPLWIETSVLVHDLDGNGLPDVVTTATLSPSMGVFEGRVKVRLQTRAGVFSAPQEYRTGLQAWTVKAADVDGDDRPDLVVGEPAKVWDNQVHPGGAWLLRQDPTQAGHFLAPTLLVSGPNVYDLDVADLNGDGVVDVALTDARTDANRVVILPQDPLHRGAFLAPQNVPMPGPVSKVVAQDLNADGQADLITAFTSVVRPDYSYDTSIGITLQSIGSFGATTKVTTFAYGSAGHLAVTGFNADGRPDVAAYFDRFDERAVPAIRLMLQAEGSTWEASIDTPLPVDTVKGRDDQAVADLNGDGRPDFVLAGTYPEGTTSDGFSIIKSQLSLLIQDASGRFVPSTSYALPISAHAVGAGDLDRDGRVDLVVYGSDYPAGGGTIDRLMVLMQSGTSAGQFLAPVAIP